MNDNQKLQAIKSIITSDRISKEDKIKEVLEILVEDEHKDYLANLKQAESR